MDHTLVNVSVPFFIEFTRRGRRNAEAGIFWEDGQVAISTVTVREAPTACGVVPGKNITRPVFSVRAFDNRLWWPLFDGPRPMSVGHYVTSATQSEGPFLAMMNLSPATVQSKPRRNAQQFFEQIFAREVDGPLEEERWRVDRRGVPAPIGTLSC
jgi:hypothetical protein